MNRHGIVFTRPRDTISFFVGLVLFAFGLIPLLIKLKFVAWSLPKFFTELHFNIAIWIIAVAGLYIVMDGFIEPPAHNLHWVLIVAGLLLFAIGLLPLLHNFGIIGLDLGRFLNNLYLYLAIITLEGLLLMIGGLTEH